MDCSIIYEKEEEKKKKKRKRRRYYKCTNYSTLQAYTSNVLNLRRVGILRSAEWQYLFDVSGQPIHPIFNGQEVQEE